MRNSPHCLTLTHTDGAYCTDAEYELRAPVPVRGGDADDAAGAVSPEYVEAYGEAAAGPDVVPVVAAPPLVSPRPQPTYPYRSLDVFRGEAVLVDDEDKKSYLAREL